MRGQPERILLVIPSPALGGAEAQTLQVAHGLMRMGADVGIALDTGLAEAAAPLAPGARIFPIPLAFDAQAPAEAMRAAQATALAPLLGPLKPDAALVCLPIPNEGLGAMQALHAAGVPMLAVAHLVRRDWAIGPGDHAAARGLDVGWAAVSDPAARRLEGVLGLPPGAVATIPNGLPSAPPPSGARFGLPPRVPVLAMVGRLDVRKGAALAPGIAAALAPAVLAMAGRGPLEEALAGQPGVHLLGQIDDVPGLLARADAFLLPSDHEGCPLSVLEAARAGCPILATRAALEAWPEAGQMARFLVRDAQTIAHVVAECLRDVDGTQRRVALACEIAAAWDEAAMVARTAWLLAARCA